MKLVQGLFEQAKSDPDKLQKLYDDWAPDYDHDIGAWGYEAPGSQWPIFVTSSRAMHGCLTPAAAQALSERSSSGQSLQRSGRKSIASDHSML
jgi:hypothetical protein